MATETKQIEVPNFEATSDGKRIFTPKQWLERFRQYTKRKYKMDITELIRGAEMNQNGWTGKEAEIQEDFIWGVGPEALYQMTRAEYKTEPDNIAVKDLIRLFNEYFLPKRNTYHNRGEFFWTKQTETETPEDFWRRLIEIEKECAFEGITAEDLLISKFKNYQEFASRLSEYCIAIQTAKIKICHGILCLEFHAPISSINSIIESSIIVERP